MTKLWSLVRSFVPLSLSKEIFPKDETTSSPSVKRFPEVPKFESLKAICWHLGSPHRRTAQSFLSGQRLSLKLAVCLHSPWDPLLCYPLREGENCSATLLIGSPEAGQESPIISWSHSRYRSVRVSTQLHRQIGFLLRPLCEGRKWQCMLSLVGLPPAPNVTQLHQQRGPSYSNNISR